MNNQTVIDNLLKQLTDGLKQILDQSYPLCKHSDTTVSALSAKINNSAFELKRATELLKSQIDVTLQR